MQLLRAAARNLAFSLKRTLQWPPAADTRLTVQQASGTLKQLRQRDALQPRSDRPGMRYPAMVIGFLQARTPWRAQLRMRSPVVRRCSGLCVP